MREGCVDVWRSGEGRGREGGKFKKEERRKEKHLPQWAALARLKYSFSSLLEGLIYQVQTQVGMNLLRSSVTY